MGSRPNANGEHNASHDPQGLGMAAAAARRRTASVTGHAGRRSRRPASTRLAFLALLLLLVSLWMAAGPAYRKQPPLVTAAASQGATPTPVELRALTARATSADHPSSAAVAVRSPPTTAASQEVTRPQPSEQPPTQVSTPRGFTLLASGDVLAHRSVQERARAYGAGSGRPYDFRPMFAAVRPIVSAADLAVCHLETPLSPSGAHLSGYPRFNAPPQLAAAIRDAGYDACSVASNHSMDQGAQGVAGTLRVLDQAGLRHAGMARSPQEARPRILTVAGVRVALLSYAYGLNGFRPPPRRPWLVNLLSPARILADARAARRAGSQFTVVFLHWGQEYRSAPTPAQRTLASKLLADPSIDLIVGHHAHVVQPVQRLHGKWVAFGMGNSLSAQSAACCPAATQDGVLLQLTVVRRAGRYVVDKVSYTPTWVEHPSYRIRPVLGALAGGSASPAMRAMLRASLRRTTAAIGPAARPTTRP
jgi:poly-gamma-glutamate capsule biosynthesis protein CapA/YwtB (metallophosphatase superfamily)